MEKRRHNPSRVHTWLVLSCLAIDLGIIVSSGISVELAPKQWWYGLKLTVSLPLLVWSAITGLYFIIFLVVKYRWPDSRFVHTKTDIIIFATICGTGLTVVVTGTVFGIAVSVPLLLASILGYINVFLILATLLYEALYVRIHYGPKWNQSLSSLAANPAMRITRDSESDLGSRSELVSAQPAVQPLLSPRAVSPPETSTGEDGDTEDLPAYEMIGSSNAAAYFGAESAASGSQTTTSAPNELITATRPGKHEVISAQERRLKQEVLDGLNRVKGSSESASGKDNSN